MVCNEERLFLYCFALQMERLQMGQAPRSLVVVLEADLVDMFNPGDDVVVVGTLQKR
jgi:DNA replicative helicase MCM subunit Mcm2 (Cdc46/Mcm family)